MYAHSASTAGLTAKGICKKYNTSCIFSEYSTFYNLKQELKEINTAASCYFDVEEALH